MREEKSVMTLPDVDLLVASSVNYLVQGSEFEAATVLLMCDVDVHPSRFGNFEVQLNGPRAAYDALTNENNPVGEQVSAAFSAVRADYGGYKAQAQFLDALDP